MLMKSSKQQEQEFRRWLAETKSSKGIPFATNTINAYITNMKKAFKTFTNPLEVKELFDIQSKKI